MNGKLNLFGWEVTINENDVRIVFKQWTFIFWKDGYKLVNLLGDGTEQFITVNMGPYGNPIFTIESTLAFACPSALTYVNAKGEQVVPTEKIGGIICQEKDGSAMIRTSLSNQKCPAFKVVDDGIEIVGGEHWYLAALFSKDKNRTFNYDAFFSREKPAQVRVLELADLNFLSLA